MEICQIEPFIDYFEKIRRRTMRVAAMITGEKLEWRYQPGKFSFGDLMRHLAATERYMYAENARFLPGRYPGCHRELADGLPQVLRYMDRCHRESLDIFRTLSEDDLKKKCLTPAGIPITLGKWLRAMVEHEVHHRGQMYLYLGMLGIATPPLFGMTAEEVQAAGGG